MAVVKRELPATRSVKKKVTSPTDAPAFQLPTEPSSPMENLGDYSILLFGEKKIGKTTLAAMFPNTLFLMTEPGGKSLSVYQTAILEWKQFTDAIRALRHDTRFQTVVVDTVDLAFKMCERFVCQRLGIEHPSEEDWGRGWGAVRDEFTDKMQKLLSLGKGVMLISHSTEREIKTRSGEKYDRIQPTMSNQARDVVEGLVDIWAYYAYNGKQRTLKIRGDEHITAGHRLTQNFRYRGKDVTEVSMGSSPEEAYTNLINAFNNRYTPTATDTEHTSAESATAPVKKVIRRLKV